MEAGVGEGSDGRRVIDLFRTTSKKEAEWYINFGEFPMGSVSTVSAGRLSCSRTSIEVR